MRKSPINTLLDRVDWRCAVCNKQAGTCNCWTKCSCGRSFRTGEKCSSDIHRKPLTEKQRAIYERMEAGTVYNAYELRASMSQLRAMESKGYLFSHSEAGSQIWPRTSIYFGRHK